MANKRGDEWQTPDWLFQALHKEFNFLLDAASTLENAKLSNFIGDGKERNGLTVAWSLFMELDKQYYGNGAVWCNPPYSNIQPWCEKANRETENGVTSVLLVPASTSTMWFYYCLKNAAEIRFITGAEKQGGRIPFIDPETGKAASGNLGGSMIVVFRPQGFFKRKQAKIKFITREELFKWQKN